MAEAETISVTEAAERLGVKGAEVLERIGRGELAAVKIDGLVRLPTDQSSLRTRPDADLEAVLDWLYVSEDSGWTCPACGYRNGGAYRLECKYCNGPMEGEAGPSNRHPLADELRRLWLRVGRPVDDEFDELLGPPDWPTTGGMPRSRPPERKP